ncbi:hypothetical protein BDQ94DRAFT_146208 [Aspergillus welwitschiae]|uniref:Uncharacterized protein n=1 Tax=Aspergillus welwitschiae TaxID=1341132 RepID=A0A3F3PYL8_9EURO|nr:hypothetical protein BDQ94DRAFT_146208 [Aspergillus welwitschiae]RDH32003.1 hypothetical protein BDQ94DRAFT_146208 [Aspergillus welwitschiae]
MAESTESNQNLREKRGLHQCYAAPSNPRSETPLNERQMNQDDCKLYGTSDFSSNLGPAWKASSFRSGECIGIVMVERWVSRLQRDKLREITPRMKMDT